MSKFPTNFNSKKRKSPFESDALHKSNTDKASNPFVSLFSGGGHSGNNSGSAVTPPNSAGTGTNNSKTGGSWGSTPNSSAGSVGAFSFGKAATSTSDDKKGEGGVVVGGGGSSTSTVMTPFCFSPVKPRDSFGNPITGPGFPADKKFDHEGTTKSTVSPTHGPSSPHSHSSTTEPGTSSVGNKPPASVSPRLSFGKSPQLHPSPSSTTTTVAASAAVLTNAPLSSLQAGGASVEDEPTYKMVDGPAQPGRWICTTCNKMKHLQGQHLVGKNRVRSDCWPCAKKRLFRFALYSEYSSPPSGGAANKQKGAAAAAGTVSSSNVSTGSVMASFQLPASAMTSSQQGVGGGGVLNSSTAAGSPTTNTTAAQTPNSQKVPGLPTPSPASWNLNAVAAKASGPGASPLGGLMFPSNPKTSSVTGERSPKSSSSAQQNVELKANLAEAQIALQASLRLNKFNASLVMARQRTLTENENPLRLRNVTLPVLESVNNEGSSGVVRLFAQVPSTTVGLDEGSLALAISDLFRYAPNNRDCGRRTSSPPSIDLSVCCHSEECFATMGLYVANTLLLEQDNHYARSSSVERLRVFGPAFDKTTQEKNRNKEVFEQMELLLQSVANVSAPTTAKKASSCSASPRTALPIGGGAGFEVQVSHQALLDATSPLYEATGWVSENTLGMAISSQIEAVEREEEGRGSGGPVVAASTVAVHLVLCGPSVPYKQLKSQLF